MVKIRATFLDEISWDIPHQNWGYEEWDRDFAAMKAVGIDTVVMIRSGLERWTAYPSEYLHRTLGTSCEEREGCGVAQVCARMGVPNADIRIISNSEWHPEEEFNEKYGEDCQKFVLEVTRRLIAEQPQI